MQILSLYSIMDVSFNQQRKIVLDGKKLLTRERVEEGVQIGIEKEEYEPL